ncbi:MAG: hypothetical protein V4474_02190 [Patescibacteria group bacterium]
MQVEKPEIYFEIPDNVAVMIALVEAVPRSWQKEGWVNGQLFSPDKSASVLFNAAGRVGHDETSFIKACRDVTYFLRRGYRGWLQFVSGAHGTALYKNPATYHLQLTPSVPIYTEDKEDKRDTYEHSARVYLGWDVNIGGSRKHVVHPEMMCRRLGLREYEITRAHEMDWSRNWDTKVVHLVPHMVAAE